MSASAGDRQARAAIQTGTATIRTATHAILDVSPSQTLAVSAAFDVDVYLGTGASASLEGQQMRVYGNGNNVVTMTSGSGIIRLHGPDTRAQVTWVDGDTRYGRDIEAGDGAQFDVSGDSYSAQVYNGGVATASGTGAYCYAAGTVSLPLLCENPTY